MDSREILERAKVDGDAPHSWIILPLSQRKVITGIIGWIFGAIVGLGLFAFMASIMIPHNYQNGTAAAIVTTILLGVVLYVGLGSIWALIMDVRRLRQANKHIIVITPEDFVKQEGSKIIQVPLMYVRHVTARGGRPPEPVRNSQSSTMREMSGLGDNIASMFFGRRNVSSDGSVRRKRMRTPTTLAFIDSRNDSEVIVVTDEAYGDPFMIAGLLKEYAASVQQLA